MELNLETIKEILNLGLGVVSFGVLIVGVYKVAVWGNTFITNHMVHLQDGVNTLNTKTDHTNEKLDKTNELLTKLVEK